MRRPPWTFQLCHIYLLLIFWRVLTVVNTRMCMSKCACWAECESECVLVFIRMYVCVPVLGFACLFVFVLCPLSTKLISLSRENIPPSPKEMFRDESNLLRSIMGAFRNNQWSRCCCWGPSDTITSGHLNSWFLFQNTENLSTLGASRNKQGRRSCCWGPFSPSQNHLDPSYLEISSMSYHPESQICAKVTNFTFLCIIGLILQN